MFTFTHVEYFTQFISHWAIKYTIINTNNTNLYL